MKVHQDSVDVRTRGRGLYDVTEAVRAAVRVSGVKAGICTVFIRHTSASLVIQENADPSVRRDMQRWIDQVAPESDTYEHDDEGPDDMPGHLRAVLTRTSENVPVTGGELALGTWQAIYLWEHRTAPHTRTLAISVLGV